MLTFREVDTMVMESSPNPHCPICDGSSFLPTAQTLSLTDILTSWQTNVGVRFHESVWEEYTRPSPRQVTLYRCDRCNFSMFRPPLTGSAEFYAGVMEKEQYVSHKWEFYQAINDIRLHNRRRVLDIGCGSGHFLDLLREKIPSVEAAGYDLNPAVADQARAKGHEAFWGDFPHSILTATGYRPFDAVCVFQILEHVADPVAFIMDIKKIMTADGLLIVGVPDAEGPVRHFADALTDLPPHHVSRWSKTVFTKGLTQHGLNVLKVAYEPLPDYLWEYYLPVMFERDFFPEAIGKRLNTWGLTRMLIRLLKRLRVRSLPGVPGHTLYAVLQFDRTGRQFTNG